MNNLGLMYNVIISVLYIAESSADQVVNVHLGSNNVANTKEESTQVLVLSKLNLYAVIFINLYILSFIFLIYICTRCDENNTNDNVIMIENGESQSELLFSEHNSVLTRNSTSQRLVTCSSESFEREWINYENIYENTYT